ncbi:hypothetical protein QAD02_010646 [Eretmocerus hayati]|uniref:Uncharacterized protein n=1 Tax=Eretmocerus hayati TaxID=131215 RepID=A0ACC2NUD5_9HYME|nr:hypothetical protein QAD02_010646 [Eretmocerus hayati]
MVNDSSKSIEEAGMTNTDQNKDKQKRPRTSHSESTITEDASMIENEGNSQNFDAEFAQPQDQDGWTHVPRKTKKGTTKRRKTEQPLTDEERELAVRKALLPSESFFKKTKDTPFTFAEFQDMVVNGSYTTAQETLKDRNIPNFPTPIIDVIDQVYSLLKERYIKSKLTKFKKRLSVSQSASELSMSENEIDVTPTDTEREEEEIDSSNGA